MVMFFSVKIERGIVCRKEYHVLEGSQFGETSMWGYPKKERATHDLWQDICGTCGFKPWGWNGFPDLQTNSEIAAVLAKKTLWVESNFNCGTRPQETLESYERADAHYCVGWSRGREACMQLRRIFFCWISGAMRCACPFWSWLMNEISTEWQDHIQKKKSHWSHTYSP